MSVKPMGSSEREQLVRDYFTGVCKAFIVGDDESLYFKAMYPMIEGFGCQAFDKNSARGKKAGQNLDVWLWHLEDELDGTPPFGGIELKTIKAGVDTQSSQIKSEVGLFRNVILTDNCSWYFYSNGSTTPYDSVGLIKVNGKSSKRLELDEDSIEKFIRLLSDFLMHAEVQVTSAEKLAECMASYAKTIKNNVLSVLKGDKKLRAYIELDGVFSKLKDELQPNLDHERFADTYAQTLVYGLFIARYNCVDTSGFNQLTAIKMLLNESALLHSFFKHIADRETTDSLNKAVERLCYLYIHSDIKKILNNENEQKDPILGCVYTRNVI